jgi:peptidyl-prolyl cis-trans isomerase A (cyclophilin A)
MAFVVTAARSCTRLLLASMLAATSCGSDGGTGPEATTETTTTAAETTTTTGPDDTTTTTADPDTTTTETGTTTGDPDTGTETTSETTGPAGPPRVSFETTLGTIVFELDPVAAPITTENFLTYVDGGFFDGTDGNGATIFHRVVPGFVVQGGGLTEDLETKNTLPPITNESGNGLTNVRGAISMARTNDPNSATCQFFINLVDNDFLDDPPGYAVFGAVVEGMDVVDAMAGVRTTTMGQFEDVPVTPIVVTAVERL